jgi:phospholipid/cholesterol/gamma-HCH transport system permease protein
MPDGSTQGAPAQSLLQRLGGGVDRFWSAVWSVPRGLVQSVGGHFILLGQVAGWAMRRPLRPLVFFEAAEFVGYQSLPIVMLVSLFVGAVFSLQLVSALRTFQAESFVGSTVALALTRELAPVFASIVIAARAGAGMATELGSMRITEQIDALSTLAVNPVQYLIVPRVVATTLMVPLMTLLFDFVGMVGAYVVAVHLENIDRGIFLENTRWYLDANDIFQGLCKSLIFGCALSLISCYQGFNASGGAKGVGVATTRAVVASFVSILVLDYFFTDVWLTLVPPGGR